MFPTTAFQRDWLIRQAKAMSGTDPQILEMSLHALTLLGHLQTAALAAHIKTGTPIDFGALRYAGNPEQNAAIKAGSFNNMPLDWLDGLKQINPAAYHYWMVTQRIRSR